MVATTSTAAATRYACDLIQLGSDSSSSSKGWGGSLVESTLGLAASQSRHSLRPSEMGNPQLAQLRTFPNLPELIGVTTGNSPALTSATSAAGVLPSNVFTPTSLGSVSLISASAVSESLVSAVLVSAISVSVVASPT